MKKMRKVIVFTLCFCLLFEQSGLAQVLNGTYYLQMPPLALFPPHLRSLAYDRNSGSFSLLLEQGKFYKNETKAAAYSAHWPFKFFLTGISLPSQSYWVDLRPDSEDQMLDDDMANTDMGRVLLAADLALKEDLANLTSPYTDTGKQYWDELYKKAEEIFGTSASQFSLYQRVWIVPGEVILSESDSGVYLYKATLNVLNEEDFLNQRARYKNERFQIFNEFASSLMKKMILPLLIKAVNTQEKYAALRQVFCSLILAQWFKERFRNKLVRYSELIDSRCLYGLKSKKTWNKREYFNQYRKSFKYGEYNHSERLLTLYGEITRNYFYGGITLGLTIPPCPRTGDVAVEGPVTIIGSVEPQQGFFEDSNTAVIRLHGNDPTAVINGQPIPLEDTEAPLLVPGEPSIYQHVKEVIGDFCGRSKAFFHRHPRLPILLVRTLAVLSAIFAPFLFPVVAYAHYFVQIGEQLFVVPEQWTWDDPAENTLFGIARDILNASGRTNASHQEMVDVARRIVEVNPDITNWNLIYAGQQYVIPPELVSEQLLANLGITPMIPSPVVTTPTAPITTTPTIPLPTGMPIGVGPTATITQPIPSTTPVTPTPSATPVSVNPSATLTSTHTITTTPVVSTPSATPHATMTPTPTSQVPIPPAATPTVTPTTTGTPTPSAQTPGFDISQILQQINQAMNDAGTFLTNSFNNHPELVLLVLLAGGIFVYLLFKWIKARRTVAHEVFGGRFIYRSAGDSAVVAAGSRQNGRGERWVGSSWKDAVEAVLKEVKKASESPIDDATCLNFLEKVRRLRNLLPFEADIVPDNRITYYQIYTEALSYLCNMLGELRARLQISTDQAARARLRIYISELIATAEYFNDCLITLHAVENIPLSAGDRFDRSTFLGRIASFIVGMGFGFNRAFRSSTNELRRHLTEKIIPMGNSLDNIYSEEDGIAEQVIKDWDAWVEACYQGKKLRLGARKGWVYLREMLTPLIALALLIFVPGAITQGIFSLLNASTPQAQTTALLGLGKTLLGMLPFIFSWYILQVSGKGGADPVYKRYVKAISKFQQQFKTIFPLAQGDLRSEALRVAYEQSLDAVSRELSAVEKSAEAIIVVTDHPEATRGFLEGLRGKMLRDDVTLLCIPDGITGSAAAFIEGVLAAQGFQRSVVLIDRREDGRVLESLPLPEFAPLGRSLTSLELALIHGYQKTQALKALGLSRAAVEFTHRCFIGHEPILSSELPDIALEVAWVDVEQMEQQDLGLIVVNDNNGNGNRGFEGRVIKMFQHVRPGQVRNKFGPRYLSGVYFDWRTRKKRQIPVFVEGAVVNLNAQLLLPLSHIKQYIAQNVAGGFQASFTADILIPLIMLSNGEGRDIHRFLDTWHLQSEEEWRFHEGLLNLFWPHFADERYRSDLEVLHIGALPSHQQASFYVRLDRSDTSQILRCGLGELYTEQPLPTSQVPIPPVATTPITPTSSATPLATPSPLPTSQVQIAPAATTATPAATPTIPVPTGMPIGVGPTATITQPIPSTTPVTPTPSATPLATPSPALEIAHTLGESQADQLPQGEQATSRRRRTTFSAEKRLGRVKDYFYSHNGAEFTVRDILENVYPGESGYDIPPSYTTTYRDLEVLARQGVVVKEKKLDPRNKRYKNFYRLSKIESTLADIEERSPGEDKSVETPPAPTTNMPENGFVVFPFFRQAGGSVPLAVVASDPDMSNTGGIDFRGLGMLVKKGIKLQEQQIYDEDFKKLEDEIEQNIKIGTLPDSMILKKWYGLAQLCRNTQTALSRVRKCIADLLKQQEKLAIATDPVEKNLLILLASVCVVNNSP